MKELLQKLFHRRNKDVKLIFLDEEEPEYPETHVIKPNRLIIGLGGIVLAVVLVVFLVMYFFQPGTSGDREMRQTVEEITHQVIALQDSLEHRDQQLADMQNAITGQSDTVFATRNISISEFLEGDAPEADGGYVMPRQDFESLLNLEPNEIIMSAMLSGEPSFPSGFPVDGQATRMYEPASGHYGVDVAAEEGTPVQSIADGIVISSDRTLQSGYVLQIQHSDGYLSVYKHCKSLLKEPGDMVRKGDIIGTVGSTGMYSSGPHLHFELWKDGVSLNPELYFHNIN